MTDIDFLKQEEVIRFILENAKSDVNTLLLNPPKNYKNRIHMIADQILARHKAAGKLDAWMKRKDLVFPPPISVEQASSFTTAAYKKELIDGNLLVDLTGGSGVDCLALSENFDETRYVEQSKELCEIFKNNASVFGRQIEIKNQKAEDFLDQFHGTATFFIDPARRDVAANRLFKLEDCSPNIKELMPLFQIKADRVLVKLSPLIDLTKTIQDIPCVEEVHIVSVKNECKELLVLIDFEFHGEPRIHAVNLETSQESFVYNRSEESNADLIIGQLSTYLYEPNSSILKSGAFKSVTHKFGVCKISANTHLYSSNELIANFPGKVFEILYTKGKEELRQYEGMINVLTRNYPLNAHDLKKKFQLKDGGSDFLIGFRDNRNKPQLVIAKRLY